MKYNRQMGIKIEKTLKTEVIYEGKIIKVKRDSAELENGKEVVREVVEHLDGVAIVAEVEGKILMVKQFRYPLKDVLYELPAGKLDSKNEDIQEAAKRELEEETGYIAGKWESIGYVLSSPGFCNEKIHLYKASELTYRGQNLDEDEFLDIEAIEKNKIFEMIKQNIIKDAKSVSAIMKAYRL